MQKVLFILLVLFSFTARAGEAELVLQVEEYLNGVDSFEANFTQKNNGEDIASGRFYLQKPGKFRWEYLKGQPILIVSNGKQLVYYDRALKEVTYAKVKNTLAGFLAREQIKFSGDVKLIWAIEDDKKISVKLTQKNKPEEGKLQLFFSKNPLQITEMIVSDSEGQKTDIVFSNQVFDSEIADAKFIFRDPKLSKNAWER